MVEIKSSIFFSSVHYIYKCLEVSFKNAHEISSKFSITSLSLSSLAAYHATFTLKINREFEISKPVILNLGSIKGGLGFLAPRSQ